MSAQETITLRTDDVGVIVRIMLTLDQAADDFLGDCERRGFRPRSVATYRRTYEQFADRLPIGTDVSKITTDDIRRYLNGKNKLANGTRAGVTCHTHALRAAFAVFYLETHQRDTLALQSLMGHKSPATTQIYLRKLDRQAEMERVRDLSWGVAVGAVEEDGGAVAAAAVTGVDSPDKDRERGVGAPCGRRRVATDRGMDSAALAPGAERDNARHSESSQIAASCFDEHPVVGAGGFEPPFPENPHQDTPHSEHLTDALDEAAKQAVSETDKERV